MAAGERIGEAGNAIGKTAKAGWEGTSKVAASAGKSVKEGTKVHSNLSPDPQTHVSRLQAGAKRWKESVRPTLTSKIPIPKS